MPPCQIILNDSIDAEITLYLFGMWNSTIKWHLISQTLMKIEAEIMV